MNLLHRLLSNPECIEPLRHDVETAVEEEGWTKAGMDKMHKIDSFLRETQRFDDLDSCLLDSPGRTSIIVLILYFLFSVAINRLALRPFTFSNGVTVPAGALITVPSGVIHKDEKLYPNPEEFDGFRFAKLREHSVDARHQALSTSVDHLTFGYGRHAWCVFFFLPQPFAVTHTLSISPGRFFAVNEVKALLAHVVVTYDIKFEEGKQAPPCFYIGSIRIAGKANAMFRKRHT